jgi:ABC-2 type transport system ATP-binding protein
VGLADRRGDRVSGFSKGMQQRLVLAQALLGEPELLVLDEPTSALDPVGRREVRDIVREAHARGATVLLNSHLLAEVEAVADHVAILQAGRLVWQGAIAALAGPGLRVDARVGGWSAALAEALAPLVEGLEVGPAADADGARALAFRVADAAGVPAVARAIVAGGGALFALTPHGESLEDAFIRLVEPARRADA